MRLVTVHLPKSYIEGLEELVKENIYPNRSEAIRVAVRDMLKAELWRNK
ncbi:MAG: ribbon-helix-helix domain-containing protein [Candidatus Helarchaeota archaeon]